MEGWGCSSAAFANSWEALGLIHRNTEGREKVKRRQGVKKKRRKDRERGGGEAEER